MKNRGQRSSLSEKILVFLLYVLGILLVIVGLPFFPVGGFIFVGLGILCFLFPKLGKKSTKSKSSNSPGKIVSPKSNTQPKGLTPGLDYVYVNKKGKSYHWDLNCRSIGNSWDMITREEARAKGLKPCKHCDTY